MSLTVSNTVWAADFGNPTKKLIMLAFSNWADDFGGRLYPSIRALACRASISKSQARRIVHELIADGVLAVVSSPKNRRGPARHYQLILSMIEVLPRATDCVGHPRRRRKPGSDDSTDVSAAPNHPDGPAGSSGSEFEQSMVDLFVVAFGLDQEDLPN